MTYSGMKDSGIPWLGEIPAHWKITRSKIVFQNVTVKNHPDATVLSLYRDLGVLPKESRDDNHNVTSEDTAQYKFVEVGNLVINKMKAWQGSLAVSGYSGIVSPAYYVCRFRSGAVEKRYIHYLLRCVAYAQEFERLSTGMRVGQWDLGIDDFLKIPILLPDTDEQKSISDFLDAKCGGIDAIIEEAKASIEEYKRWKASVIYQAVTKGLNPDAPMKDSGVSWIGEIPATWDTCAIKRFSTKIGSGKTPSGGAEVYSDTGVIFLRSQNVYNEGLRLSDVSHISPEIDDSMSNTRVRYNDVLLNITGGSMGRCCLFDLTDTPANVNQHVCIIRTIAKIVRPEFLRYFWISESGPMAIGQYQTGGNRPGLNFEQIGNTKIPLCSPDEQDGIIRYLDRRCKAIDNLIEEKQSLIAELEAYKKSLIYEAVTGKRKVG